MGLFSPDRTSAVFVPRITPIVKHLEVYFESFSHVLKTACVAATWTTLKVLSFAVMTKQAKAPRAEVEEEKCSSRDLF